MTSGARIEPIERATGRTWQWWLDFMTSIGAEQLDHAAIALRVEEELRGEIESAAWWAQGITVAWEQQSGRRLPGQRADGTFQTSISKTTGLDMQALAEAWRTFASSDAAVQAQISAEPRHSGTEKRINWRTKGRDGVAITISSEPRKGGGSALVVQVVGNPSPEANSTTKATWSAILSRFIATIQ
ncbi:MAG: hypothetical protein IT334_05360 [Thermomicrobiales bacterium]|nr:hypothetical protein [Thermomicrobiales bacterium]